jgi:hypothetical protein
VRVRGNERVAFGSPPQLGNEGNYARSHSAHELRFWLTLATAAA